MKINIFKNFLLAGILLSGGLVFQSCNDEWLDLKPDGRPVGDEVPLGALKQVLLVYMLV